MGGWAWRWVAWSTTGAYVPSAGSTLTQNASYFGSSFYLHIRGFNSEGVPNGTLDLGPFHYWDGTHPVTPTVVDDGAYTTADYIHAQWSPIGPSADYYEYAVGTALDFQSIIPFTNVGLAREITHDNLSLAEGETYYVTVRGTAGSNNVTGSCDGITVAPRIERISEAKALVDTDSAALYGKTVTAVFPDYAYVQEQRGPGVRVFSRKTLAVGDVVDLAGRMAGADTEKRMEADTVVERSSGSVGPTAMAGLYLGGRAFEYSPESQTGQQAVSAYCDGVLLELPSINNVGMLVTVLGRVTQSNIDGFYLDDGSGWNDFAVTGPGSPPGVKVSVPLGVTTPPEGSYAVVTGINSVSQADVGLRRLVLVRQQSDIVVY